MLRLVSTSVPTGLIVNFSPECYYEGKERMVIKNTWIKTNKMT